MVIIMAKGSSFENKVAKEISFWLSYGERGDIFYRTAGSGSRLTVRTKKGAPPPVNCGGDICSMDPLGFPFLDFFHVEIKKGYTGRKRFKRKEIEDALSKIFELHDTPLTQSKNLVDLIKKLMGSSSRSSIGDFIEKSTGEPLLYTWRKKAEKERQEAKRKAILIIFQKDQKNACVMLDLKIFNEIESFQINSGSPAYIVQSEISVRYREPKNKSLYSFILLPYKEFFEWLKPETINALLLED